MSWETTLDKRIAVELPELRYVSDEPLARHTSFRIGGPAKRMAFPSRAGEAVRLLELARECGAEPLVLGNGTNVLAPDEGLDRLVIDMSAGLTRMDDTADGDIMAECGVPLGRVAEFAKKLGLTGLEFAHGIPGTVGGAVVMNAGAYGGEMKDVVCGVLVYDPANGVRLLKEGELDFAYRRSVLSGHPDWVALYAIFRLQHGDSEKIGTKMRDLMARRKASQPLEFPSAGSTFKRPEGYFAGTLIEQCGLKGARVGGAEVSAKHAGFIVNTGGATCADVLALIGKVRKTVFDATGVTLEPEVRIWKS